MSDVIKKISEDDMPVPSRPKNRKIDSDIPMKGKQSVPGTATPISAPIKNVAVQNMQRAIQDLSRTIANEKLNPKTKTVIQTNKNFNNFIGHHYIQTITKVEAPNPDEPTEPTAAPAQTSVQSIMQHLSGLDNIKNFRPNGVWGSKTNEALENIYKLAYSMLQVAGDFGLLDNSIYNNTYLNGLKDKISGYTFEKNKISLTPEEQEQRATSIIKHIHAIERFYNHLKKEISSQPNLRSHIEEKKPFENYNSTGTDLSPEEMEFSNKTINIENVLQTAPALPGQRINYIPIKSLRSKKDYLDWMRQIGIVDKNGKVDEEKAIAIFNTIIKPQIEKK